MHVDSPVNAEVQLDSTHDRAYFCLINLDPDAGRRVGVYKTSHHLFDLVQRNSNPAETTAQLRAKLHAQHPLKQPGSTLPVEPLLVDFLCSLVCDMSLSHFGGEGPGITEEPSRAFVIHAAVVPKTNTNPEEFDLLPKHQNSLIKRVLQVAGGDLYLKHAKFW